MEELSVQTRSHWVKIINTVTGLEAVENVDYARIEKHWGFKLQGKNLLVVYLLSAGSDRHNKRPCLYQTDENGVKILDKELNFPHEGLLDCSAEIAMEFLNFDPYEDKKEEILSKWKFWGFKVPNVEEIDPFEQGIINLVKIGNWEQIEILKNSFPQYFR